MVTGNTRREFMKTAALATGAAGTVIKAYGKKPPSERVRLGFIGTGRRGRQLLGIFQQFSDVDIVAICDAVEPQMDEAMTVLAKGPYPQKPERVVEYRRILDRKDIDAVVIATTEHWHGLPHIHACQAGKHIFVEKPLSHTVVEGRAMVQAAKKYGVIALMGSQQRAGGHYKKAVELIQSGRLGKIPLVECWNYNKLGLYRTRRAGLSLGDAKSDAILFGPDADPPPGYHWDLWLGPAPYAPFNPSRFAMNSWWFDYAGGMLTNWAIHHIDIILWAMQATSPTTVVSVGGKLLSDDRADTPDTQTVTWEFPGFVMHYTFRGFNGFDTVADRPNHPNRPYGIYFYGTQGTMFLDRFGYEVWSDSNPKEPIEKADGVPGKEQDGPWHRLFLDCVKEGKESPLNLEVSHKATVCCHLGNVAYHVGRRIHWDGEKEEIAGDPEASRLLTRPRRKGFELPKV